MAAGNFDINDLKRRMEGALTALKHELGGLRTGRAAISAILPASRRNTSRSFGENVRSL